jgi:hypothetical protein
MILYLRRFLAFNRTYLTKLNEFFFGVDMKKMKFIPILIRAGSLFPEDS